jgi:hypothetical protein
LLLIFALNIIILKASYLYIILFVGQVLFYFFGVLALFGVVKGNLVSIVKYFLITFLAQFIGCVRMLIGIEDIMWTPKR